MNFLKLTNRIINKAHIKQIVHHPEYVTDVLKTKVNARYSIHLANENPDGFFIFTVGWINSKSEVISVCKEEDAADYYVITREWFYKKD